MGSGLKKKTKQINELLLCKQQRLRLVQKKNPDTQQSASSQTLLSLCSLFAVSHHLRLSHADSLAAPMQTPNDC